MDSQDELVVRQLLAVSRGGTFIDDNDFDGDDDADDDHDREDLSFCTTIDPNTGKVTHLSLGRRIHRSSVGPMSSMTGAWDLPHVVARLSSLQYLSLGGGCRSLPIASMTTMTQLKELCLTDFYCPILRHNDDDKDYDGSLPSGIDLPQLSSLSIQYSNNFCFSGGFGGDRMIDDNEGLVLRGGLGSSSITTTMQLLSLSLKRILSWSIRHCTGLKYLSISLRGVMASEVGQTTNVSDMILKYLSPDGRSIVFLDHLESLTLSGCGLTEHHLESLIFDHQILSTSNKYYSKLKHLSVDRNNIESLQFITHRIQEHHHHHQMMHHHHQQQQLCSSSSPFGVREMIDDDSQHDNECETPPSYVLRPIISECMLEYLNLSDNPIMTRLQCSTFDTRHTNNKSHAFYRSCDDDDDDDEEEERREVTSLWQLLYMIPRLHYIGYPSHVASIIRSYPDIDSILRMNRGGRWLVVRHHRDDYEHHHGHDRYHHLEQQRSNGLPSSLWPQILQRSYDQSSTFKGLSGTTSSIPPFKDKDASAMFFLLREGDILMNMNSGWD